MANRTRVAAKTKVLELASAAAALKTVGALKTAAGSASARERVVSELAMASELKTVGASASSLGWVWALVLATVSASEWAPAESASALDHKAPAS
jgi:hypothetical protein